MMKSDLSKLDIQLALPERNGPHWRTLEYCRHIGLHKRLGGPWYWVARIRTKAGGYRQNRLAEATSFNGNGLGFHDAVQLAREWFGNPNIQALASEPYPLGPTEHVRYESLGEHYTVGDALVDFIEWKRIAATKTTFQTLVSLINFHLVPRLGSVPLDQLTGQNLVVFCRDILESPPKRGNQALGSKVDITSLEPNALRKRKSTLNTLLGILRMAVQMSWENGHTDSERAWRCIRRVPNIEVPRHLFLTRAQCTRLIATCRPDLADLVRAALYTGCRVTELAEIRVRDVGQDVFGVYIRTTKSRRPHYVYLPLEGMRFFLSRCDGVPEDELVFRTWNGKTWNGRYKHLFRRAVAEAGLPRDFVFHGLRHTYASQLVQAATPLTVVARQLGHANTDTVSRTYGHLSCWSIERELHVRFADLENQSNRFDHKMRGIRRSLQNIEPETGETAWPRSNFCQLDGPIAELLKGR